MAQIQQHILPELTQRAKSEAEAKFLLQHYEV
jgi:hypothetical protein